MKVTDLRGKSKEELRDSYKRLLEDQFKLRMLHAQGKLAKTHQIQDVRKDIARHLALLNQMEGK